MKPRPTLLALLPLMLLMTSCWKTDEDWSLCAPQGNLVLTFHLAGVDDGQFDGYIQGVDVYLFDAERCRLIASRNVASPMADGRPGTTFTLDPGTYHVVCWGNASANSHLLIQDDIPDFETNFIEIDPATSGAPLYYAPDKTPQFHPRTGNSDDDYAIYRVVVPEGEEVTRPMTFVKAHRTVEAFVSGYESTAWYDGAMPLVERSGARSRYDFLLQADSMPNVLLQPVAPYSRVPETRVLSAAFHSTLNPLVGDGYVSLIQPTTRQIIAQVKLIDYVAQNQIVDDSYIPIHFTLTQGPGGGEEGDPSDVKVSVEMPWWLDNAVEPEF